MVIETFRRSKALSTSKVGLKYMTFQICRILSKVVSLFQLPASSLPLRAWEVRCQEKRLLCLQMY